MSYVYARSLALLAKLAEAKGLLFEGLVTDAGIDLAVIDADDAMISLDKYLRLQDALLQQSADEDFGLLVGRLFYMESFHLYMYLASTSHTLKEWFNFMPSVPTVMGDVGRIVPRVDHDYLVMEAYVEGGDLSRRSIVMDSLLMSAALVIDGFSLLPVRPVRVAFSYPEPNDTQGLRDVFRAPLHFNRSVNALYYHKSVLGFQLVHVSTQAYESASVKEEMKEFLADFTWESDSFTLGLYSMVRRQLPSGEYSVNKIAKLLNMSGRTLQRRLQDRGTNYQRFLQQVKASLAMKLLKDKGLNIIQVALLLGYADSASFSTAFKSWYGCSPRAFRRAPHAYWKSLNPWLESSQKGSGTHWIF